MDIRRTVSGKSLRHFFVSLCRRESQRKKDLLLKHHIALWDVIAECDIAGSSDSSIKNVVPAELSVILDHAPIRTIYANGAKAYDLYQKYTYPVTGRDIRKLPSTSPANAVFQMERLLGAWQEILEKHQI